MRRRPAAALRAVRGRPRRDGRFAPRDAALDALFPRQATGSDGTCNDVVDAEHDRFAAQDALYDVLAEMAAPSGLLFVLEDLHWASEGTREAVASIVRAPRRVPLLLVVTTRNEVSSPAGSYPRTSGVWPARHRSRRCRSMGSTSPRPRCSLTRSGASWTPPPVSSRLAATPCSCVSWRAAVRVVGRSARSLPTASSCSPR